MKRLKIQGILKLNTESKEVDLFKTKTYDNMSVSLSVRMLGDLKYFLISTRFEYIGFTTSANEAFEYYHSASIYTLHELVKKARGKL